MSNYYPYHAQSSVPIEIFQLFHEYWQNGIIPQINSGNILHYRSLNDEFGIMEELLRLPEYESLFEIDIWINEDQNNNPNRASAERHLALKLETYLINQADVLCQIPINSLYNIFNPHRKKFDRPR